MSSKKGDQPVEMVLPDNTAGGILPAVLTSYGISVAEIINTNFGGEPISPFDLERVRVPAGGSTYWMLATPNKPEGEPKESFTGVIVHARFGRTYWVNPLGEGGGGVASVPPDCYSDDGKTGIGTPGGDCEQCPFNAWGSDPKGGKGKACRQARLLFIVSPDSFLPRVLVCPAGSLKSIRNYMARLSNVGRPFWAVSTEFRLTRALNRGNQPFGQVTPKMAALLTDEQVARIKEYAETLKPIFAQVRVEASEVVGHEDDGI